MKKNDMIKVVATKTGYTQKDIGTVLDTIIDTIIETVASGDEVSITGFGKFGITERAERQGRNPQTGETITIAASKSPKFKAASTFKTSVNQ